MLAKGELLLLGLASGEVVGDVNGVAVAVMVALGVGLVTLVEESFFEQPGKAAIPSTAKTGMVQEKIDFMPDHEWARLRKCGDNVTTV